MGVEPRRTAGRLGWPAIPPQDGVKPGLARASGPQVSRDPDLLDAQRQGRERLAQRRLGVVNKEPPVALMLPLALFEGEVPDPIQLQRLDQPRRHCRKGAAWHMQQRGAAPDPVERRLPSHVRESEVMNSGPRADPLPGEGHHGRRGVEAVHTVASLGKGQAVPARPAAGVQDAPAGPQVAQEAPVERCQVQFCRLRRKARGVLLIVGQRL
jgi:hypothetical protein